MKTFDIEFFQHRDDRRGYVAIYKVEDVDVPTSELEYNTAQDNCLWFAPVTFTLPRMGHVDTVETIIRVAVDDNGMIHAQKEYHQWLGSATGRFLNGKLYELTKEA